jgi:ribose/xylose/arabinose/galactoside ABC-type transport system permease subunit
VPNLVRSLVADMALGAAFVPVFSELLEKNDRQRAWRVASTLLWLLLLALTAVTAVFILLAPLIMPPLTSGYDDLTVTLSQILFPIVVLIALIVLTIVLFGIDATNGPLQVALLLSAAFAALIAFMKDNNIPPDALDSGKTKVLVVDDDPEIVELFVDVLERDGRFEVKTAGTGYELDAITAVVLGGTSIFGGRGNGRSRPARARHGKG